MQNDLAAERGVLCGLLQFGEDVNTDIEDILTTSCFTDPKNQIIYKCIEKALEETSHVDESTLLSKANELNQYDIINNTKDLEYISSLRLFPVEKSNVIKLARKLVKLKIVRDLSKEAYLIQKKLEELSGNEKLSDIIEIAEARILDFCENLGEDEENKIQKLSDGIDEHTNFLIENKADIAGVPTGLPNFDVAIGGGIRRKGVTLIGARPKTGKTTLSCQIALNVGQNQGIPVLFLDSEMDRFDIIHKLLANLSGIRVNDVEIGRFADSNDRILKVKESAEQIKELPIYYHNIAGQAFDSILSYVRRWIKKVVGYDENGRLNDCLVIYDYFKVMDSNQINKSMQEYQVIGFQLSKMVNFCVKNDVPCLSFVQLNRQEDVSQSDRLSWFAQSVSMLLTKSEDEIAQDGLQNGNLKLDIKYTRYGEGVAYGNYINILRMGEFGRMEEKGTRDQIKKE